jgi:hypothetical protein
MTEEFYNKEDLAEMQQRVKVLNDPIEVDEAASLMTTPQKSIAQFEDLRETKTAENKVRGPKGTIILKDHMRKQETAQGLRDEDLELKKDIPLTRLQTVD